MKFSKWAFRISIIVAPIVMALIFTGQDVAQDHSISRDDAWVIGLAVANAVYNALANWYRAYTESLEAQIEVLTRRDADDDQLTEGPPRT